MCKNRKEFIDELFSQRKNDKNNDPKMIKEFWWYRTDKKTGKKIKVDNEYIRMHGIINYG